MTSTLFREALTIPFLSDITLPPDVVLLFSYIMGLLSIVRFYWTGSIGLI